MSERCPVHFESHLKRCNKCKVTQTFDNFRKNKSMKDGLCHYCKPCQIQANFEYESRHRDDVNSVKQQWKRNNKEKISVYRSESKERLKKDLIDGYGGCCSCCGEKHVEFLTLEHLKGGGNQHRKRSGGHLKIYRELRVLGFPKEDFTIMCMNCNFARRLGKECPHKK